LAITATYSYNSGSSTTITLTGIISLSSSLTIAVVSTSVKDSGTYDIILTIKDYIPSTISASLKIDIANKAPNKI